MMAEKDERPVKWVIVKSDLPKLLVKKIILPPGTTTVIASDFIQTIRKSTRKIPQRIEDMVAEKLKDICDNDSCLPLKIANVPGKGKGIIATKNIYQGDFVVEYAGDLIASHLAVKRNAMYEKNPNAGSYMFEFMFEGRKHCIDATKDTGRFGRLVNHSRKNPNCDMKMLVIEKVPKLILFAAKNIKYGEEIVYDYGDRDKDTLQELPWLAES